MSHLIHQQQQTPITAPTSDPQVVPGAPRKPVRRNRRRQAVRRELDFGQGNVAVDQDTNDEN